MITRKVVTYDIGKVDPFYYRKLKKILFGHHLQSSVNWHLANILETSRFELLKQKETPVFSTFFEMLTNKPNKPK